MLSERRKNLDLLQKVLSGVNADKAPVGASLMVYNLLFVEWSATPKVPEVDIVCLSFL